MANGLRNSMYGTAAGQLRGVVGTWRDMKLTGNIALHQMMVGGYNMAVQNVNVGN